MQSISNGVLFELKRVFPNASKSCLSANVDQKWPKSEYDYEDHPDPQLQDTEPQRDQAPALGAAKKGKDHGVSRITTRFIGYRCRPLDADNFAAGCKDLLDGLRHSGLIPNDDPSSIVFVAEQVKVSHRSQEKTVIEIEMPEP
jgi:hypothetical protein